MTGYQYIARRRFRRNSSRAVIGGVCAGLADHFGFNLKVTRILAVVSLLFAMPATLLIYFAIVFLVPAVPDEPPKPDYNPEFRRAVRSDPRQTMGEIGRRYRKLDARLARLERYVTSSRFHLDQEFRSL